MKFSLYVHFPFCVSKCAYCGFYSVSPETLASESCSGKNRYIDGKKTAGGFGRKFPDCLEGSAPGKIPGEIEDLYFDSFEKELKYFASVFDITEWETLYFGGGSPSLMSERLLCRLTGEIGKITGSKEWKEATIEANPAEVTGNWVYSLKKAGINRVSLGIQSMTDSVLRRIYRRADKALNKKALEILSSSGLRWSCDIISGLPGETLESFYASLQEILKFSPPHVSLYSLSVDEGSGLEKELSPVQQEQLLDFGEELHRTGVETLLKNGYLRYEISNYAKSGEESLHNLNYWNMGNWLGIGPGASGTVFYQGNARRFNTRENVMAWFKNPVKEIETENLDLKTCMKEFLMMGLRIRSGVEGREFLKRFGLNPRYIFSRLPVEFFPFFSGGEKCFSGGEKCFSEGEKACPGEDSRGFVYSLTDSGFENYNAVVGELFNIIDAL